MLPVALADAHYTGAPDLVKAYVDVSSEPAWTHYRGQLTGIDGAGLTMTAANASGNAVQLHLYVSDDGTLTRATLRQAHLLLDVDLPANMPMVNYDAGATSLDPEVGHIMADGKFYLYVTGAPELFDVRTTGALLRLTMHTQP